MLKTGHQLQVFHLRQKQKPYHIMITFSAKFAKLLGKNGVSLQKSIVVIQLLQKFSSV
jgi:hypothetical protein